jgi:hypothetical protein
VDTEAGGPWGEFFVRRFVKHTRTFVA